MDESAEHSTSAERSAGKPGALLGFGYNATGQVGNGEVLQTRIFEPSRVRIPIGAGVYVRAVACGNAHSACVLSNGQLYTWGANRWGQLGHGDVSNRPTPSHVSRGLDAQAITVACGGEHTLVATASGKLYTCGANARGQLGLGRITVAGARELRHVTRVNGARCIAAGSSHSLVLDDKGAVFAFGWNEYGQLGLNHQRTTPAPAKVPLENVIKLAAGRHHSIALLADGRVYSWGAGTRGQTASATRQHRRQPHPVAPLQNTTIVDIAAGYYHTLCLDSTGSVWSFGYSGDGALGTSQAAPSNPSATRGVGGIGGGADLPEHLHCEPVCVLLGESETRGATVQAVAAGGWHSAVLLTNGDALLFGWTDSGRLGDGHAGLAGDLDGGDGFRPRRPLITKYVGDGVGADEEGGGASGGEGVRSADESAGLSPLRRAPQVVFTDLALGGAHTIAACRIFKDE